MSVKHYQIASETDVRSIVPQGDGENLYAVPESHSFRVPQLQLTLYLCKFVKNLLGGFDMSTSRHDFGIGYECELLGREP